MFILFQPSNKKTLQDKRSSNAQAQRKSEIRSPNFISRDSNRSELTTDNAGEENDWETNGEQLISEDLTNRT